MKSIAQDKISWYVNEWAPYNITRGKLKRKGINDRLVKHIHKFLPSYDIEWKNMSPMMLNKAFSNGDNICQLDLFKTPQREKIAYFTTFPTIIDAPLRLFIKAKDQQRLGFSGSVDMNEIVADKGLSASFVSGRSYNQVIDQAINSNDNRKIKSEESTKRVLKHFFKGKSDYVVEYSAVMSYFKSTLKYKKDILSLPINGTEQYVLGYAACSKSLWGKTAIDAIDAVLKEQRHSPEYKKILEQWHDARSKQLIIDNYQYF